MKVESSAPTAMSARIEEIVTSICRTPTGQLGCSDCADAHANGTFVPRAYPHPRCDDQDRASAYAGSRFPAELGFDLSERERLCVALSQQVVRLRGHVLRLHAQLEDVSTAVTPATSARPRTPNTAPNAELASNVTPASGDADDGEPDTLGRPPLLGDPATLEWRQLLRRLERERDDALAMMDTTTSTVTRITHERDLALQSLSRTRLEAEAPRAQLADALKKIVAIAWRPKQWIFAPRKTETWPMSNAFVSSPRAAGTVDFPPRVLPLTLLFTLFALPQATPGS